MRNTGDAINNKERKKERRKINKETNKPKGSKEGFDQVEDSTMRDSINRTRNRKAQQERGAHAIDSTRGIPNRLVEQRCMDAKKSQFGNSREK